MKRKRPKGGWTKQATKALRTAVDEEYAEHVAAAAHSYSARTVAVGAAPFFVVGAAAVCARNQLAFREATPAAVRAILAADPVKWPMSVALSHTALWDANCDTPWARRGARGNMFARQWAELAVEIGYRLERESLAAAHLRGRPGLKAGHIEKLEDPEPDVVKLFKMGLLNRTVV